MAFEIAWLESARKELDAEIEYVYSEFGEDSARRARTKIKEAVDPLDTFPDSGMRCDGFMYSLRTVKEMYLCQAIKMEMTTDICLRPSGPSVLGWRK